MSEVAICKSTEHLTVVPHGSLPCLFNVHKYFESLGPKFSLGFFCYLSLLYFITLFTSFKALITSNSDFFFCLIIVSTLEGSGHETRPSFYISSLIQALHLVPGTSQGPSELLFNKLHLASMMSQALPICEAVHCSGTKYQCGDSSAWGQILKAALTLFVNESEFLLNTFFCVHIISVN